MHMDLKIRPEARNGVKVVRLEGEVNHHNAQQLDDSLTEHVERGERVILDMANISLMTSPGLGLLIKHTERLRDPDRLVIAGLQPRVLEIFRALGLDQFFVITDSVDDAVRFLASHAAEE